MWNIGDPLVQMVISMCAIGLIAANGVNGAIGNIGCWWSINANGNFLASMNPVESLISMFNGACEMWHIAIQWCHWFQWCHWYHWNHCHHWRYCCQWYLPLCDQCIIIVSNATPLLLLAPILPLPPLFTIGAINFSWMFETLHCHEMALMEPFKWHHWSPMVIIIGSNGDCHWVHWPWGAPLVPLGPSPLAPMDHHWHPFLSQLEQNVFIDLRFCWITQVGIILKPWVCFRVRFLNRYHLLNWLLISAFMVHRIYSKLRQPCRCSRSNHAHVTPLSGTWM